MVGQLPAAPAGWAGTPTGPAVDAAALTSGSPLLEECFGPVALVAEYGSEAELACVLAALRDDNPWRVPRRVDGVAA